MKLDCLIITDQGDNFTVAIVPPEVLSDPAKAQQTLLFLQHRHFHMPTVLMARNASATPNMYYGPGHLALRLLRVPLETAHWQQVALR
jgi:hypothetical protein